MVSSLRREIQLGHFCRCLTSGACWAILLSVLVVLGTLTEDLGQGGSELFVNFGEPPKSQKSRLAWWRTPLSDGFLAESTYDDKHKHRNATEDEDDEPPNPSIYGWTPEVLPDPIARPHHCRMEDNNTVHLCDPDAMLVDLVTVAATLTSDMGVAIVHQMNLPLILNHEPAYYYYESNDETDWINDAAQLFGRSIRKDWFGDDPEAIVLFLSIHDRVCAISTQDRVVFPWWRVDRVVEHMKAALAQHAYAAAVAAAIAELRVLQASGPPTLQERISDFCSRFGLVIGFATFTFVIGAWGEYRDRKKRWQYAESRSQLSNMERDKAVMLQAEYQTKACPICLENLKTKTETVRGESYTMPAIGVDGKKVKLLRCGHVFCESCWKSYVHSGCGNPCSCPMCRQDVGKSPRKRRRSRRSDENTPLLG